MCIMNRTEFRNQFNAEEPVILPVIHALDETQVRANVEIVIGEGAQGVFLINHDFPKERLIPILPKIRERFPNLWIGVNFLAVTGRYAFPILGDLARKGVRIDGYWADDACIDERRADGDQPEADAIDAARAASGWAGLYFGGTAFKSQRVVPTDQYPSAARIAKRHMDVVTTSGLATGVAADAAKIKTFREAVGEGALGLASGVSPENVKSYAPYVDVILVATGINREGDFYNIDPKRLGLLRRELETA